MGTELDAELKILHSLPLGEFTAARNALGKRLRKEGDAQAADYVLALPKPTVSAWAVNLLFQREGERMDALLAAGEQARGAQQATLSGGGAEGLRETLRAVRDLQADLQARGEAILAADGKAPGRPVTDRLATDLQALAFSPAAAEAIRRGWLSADLDPPGFEVLAGLQLAALPSRPAAATAAAAPAPVAVKAPPKPGRDPKAEQRDKEREKEEAEQRARVQQAEREVERVAAEMDFLNRKAEQAEAAAQRAEAVAEEAQRKADEADEKAEEARENADRAWQRAQEAEAGLAQARKALAALQKKETGKETKKTRR